MVARYDVIISRWSNFFGVKMRVFTTSFNNKSKVCNLNYVGYLFMCYFKCQEQKNYQFSQFLPDLWFFLKFNMAAKMATILGDVTDLQQRHHPLNIPHFFEKINGFPLKAKSFGNTATYCAYVREFKKKTHTTRKNTNTPTNWTIRTHTTNQKRTNNNGFRNTKKHPLFLSMFPFDTQIS